ncbi:MAG: PKD domain-containing protein, partial [bacterium]
MRFLSIPIAALILSLLLACSGGGEKNSPTAPDLPTTEKSQTVTTSESNHYLWGLWECAADPDSGTLIFTPLRDVALHANVVKFLESGAVMKLKISNLSFDGMICDVDVSLTHPFPGLDFYTGFDVAGIFISKGTTAGFNDPDINLAGAGDTRLLNADGLSRWWNPVEFPLTKTIFGYNDGKLGQKQSVANFDCTLNGYKLFSNDLELNDDVLSLGPTDYMTFSPGYTNARHYTIDFAGGVIFNYAVDANWEPPSGSSPYEPADFPEGAWRPEAWAFSITEVENSLWNELGDNGGDLSLIIDVWDHFNAGLNTITADSPGNFDPVTILTPIGGGDGYSTYQIDIVDATPSPNSIDLLISAESEIENYGGLLEGKKVTSYFMYTAEVGAQTQSAPVAIMEATTSTDISVDGEISFDATASTGTPPLTFTWDFNADGTYDGPEDTYTGAPETPTHQFTEIGTFNVTVKVTNGAGEDISDAVPVHVGLDPNDIYVDGDYTGGNSDGSPSKPFLTIQEGMNAVTPAHNKVHVDYLDGGTNVYDTAGLTLKSNCKLMGDNWNGGGPGKPKADNTTQIRTFGMQYGSVSDITIEGFEVGMGEVPDNPSHYGFYFTGGNNITLRHNNIKD